MSCRKGLVVVYILSYLLHIIVAVIVLPSVIDCSSNSYIPPDHRDISMSMQSWITGNMVASIIIVVFMCVISRIRTTNKYVTGLVIFLYIAYNLFTFFWSLTGISMYNEYYGEACKYSAKYAPVMNLGFYSGLIYSSIMVFGICVGCCIFCQAVARGEQE